MRVVIPYAPRPLQRVIHQAMAAKRRGVIVCHRRFGKTVCALNHLQLGATTCRLPRPRFAYIAPTYAQGKAIAWDYLKHYARPIPAISINESELRVDYPNGGQVRIYGADNPDSLRGLYFDGVVLDEYGLMRPETLPEVVGPTLIDRKGWLLLMGTPKGKNQFHREYMKALGDEQWFSASYPVSQTQLLSAEELALARAGMTDDEYQQEFECSFEASVKGAVYAREMQRVREDGRITQVPYDPSLPVDTNWDLGYRDETAIWFSQSAHGGVVRLIDYYASSGEALDHYCQVVQRKPYVYGDHWMPHDVEQHEMGTGKRLIDLARAHLRSVHVAPKLDLASGLHAVRMLLPRCWFDATTCEQGLDALTSYRYHYNSEVKAYTNRPEHDWASHGADALRTLAVRYDPVVRRTEREARRDQGEVDHYAMLRREYGFRPQRAGGLGRRGVGL